MTDPMELVGRATEKNAPGHINLIDSDTTEELLDLIAEMAACIREMVGAQTELAAAARAYFVGWMMDEADDSGPEYTGCSIEQHLAAKRLGEALPPAPGAEDDV